jgi:hypothetical protein
VVEPDQKEDQRRPREPVQRAGQGAHRQQHHPRRHPDHPVPPGRQGVGDAAAVELPDRDEVEGGYEAPDPGGVGHGMRGHDGAVRQRPEAKVDEQSRQHRVPEAAEAGVAGGGHHARPREAEDQRRDGDQQAGQRAGRRDVEE